jgi:hypothetical protein
VTNDECAILVRSEQPVRVVEFNTDLVARNIGYCQLDSQEFPTFMHGRLHVNNATDNGVAKHDRCVELDW